MRFRQTPFQKAYIVDLETFEDDRGSFARQFCTKEFEQIHFFKPIIQINHSITRKKGSVRGMHYQVPPACESKIIRCIQGRIFDVMVDLRAHSSTFMTWHAVELSRQSSTMLFIPEGVAHGFQTLTDDVEMIYLHSQAYMPEYEKGIRFDEPQLSIQWPLPFGNISSRDLGFESLSSDFKGLDL